MPPVQPSQMSPLALSLLGLEEAGFLPPQPSQSRPRGTLNTHENNQRTRQQQHQQLQQSRADRRVTSYFNPFQSKSQPCNDAPPSYASSVRQARFPPSPRYLDNGNEILPKYTSTVDMEGPAYMCLESYSPFTLLPDLEWKEVYVILRGTRLSIHKLKTSSFGERKIAVAGREVKKYTLQQAEVGLATDVTHSVLLPNSRVASLIPTIARKKALEKDPDLFRHEEQFSLRVRAELDQFLIAVPNELVAFQWVNKICASIDIAAPLDDRSLPRQCTMPRRRRRQARPFLPTDLTDIRFIEQQQRLLETMYPSLAGMRRPTTDANVAVDDQTATAAPEAPLERMISPVEEEVEDVDLSMLAEDAGPSGPSRLSSTQRLSPAGNSTAEPALSASPLEVHVTDPRNLDDEGKWAPPHPRTAGQQLRYIRRCTPVLLDDMPRHSSVMVANGRYVRANYRIEILEEWTLKPPTYEVHDFSQVPAQDLVRRSTRSSVNSHVPSSPIVEEIRRADSPNQDMEISTAPKLTLTLNRSSSQKQANETGSPPNNSELQSKMAQESDLNTGFIVYGF
ncbi:hypothetical protein MBLNU457_1971t1 [Dothideomycetes sp. NU457]